MSRYDRPLNELSPAERLNQLQHQKRLAQQAEDKIAHHEWHLRRARNQPVTYRREETMQTLTYGRYS